MSRCYKSHEGGIGESQVDSGRKSERGQGQQVQTPQDRPMPGQFEKQQGSCGQSRMRTGRR